MTTFRTPFGNFYYTVMPFGLKNTGATSQRAMTIIFHDMIHNCVEYYVDDLVVKSKKKEDHLKPLRKVFERCRKYELKMNPLKCAFGVTERKFLGFSIDKEGIKVDQDKVKAVLAMKPLRNLKQIREFIGKISYLRRYIPALANVIRTLHQVTKKIVEYQWNDQHQQAFEELKQFLSNTHTMIAPSPDKELLVYLTASEEAVGVLIALEI